MITFTEDDVVAAYKKHPEYRPAFRTSYGRRKDGSKVCCPATIMCLDRGGRLDSLWTVRLGLSPDEILGFIAAVDLCGSVPLRPKSKAGYLLGRRVLKRLAAEGMLSPKLTAKVLALPDPE